MDAKKLFEESLSMLKGQVCWGVAAGEGTGYALGISFGGKIKRRIIINNPHLTEEQRIFKAEFRLMIWCPWCLTQNEWIITSSNDGDDNDGPMVKGVKKIVGETIVDIVIEKVTNPIFYFTNSFVLEIFCDQGCDEEQYCFFTPLSIYSINNIGNLTIENQSSTTPEH